MQAEQEIQHPVPVHGALKAAAKLFSYIFHPLFIPTFVFFWLLLRFPYGFAGITPMLLFARKVTVFWMTAFFPAFAVFLLWRLKFIDSIFLKTAKERIVPYIITMIFYWWMWYLSRNFTDQPIVLKYFFLGIFVATSAALVLNSFFKISMHAIGVGGLLAFVVLTAMYYQVYLGLDIAVATIITGIVCTSRLLLGGHNNFELYAGLLVGLLCQVIAFQVG